MASLGFLRQDENIGPIKKNEKNYNWCFVCIFVDDWRCVKKWICLDFTKAAYYAHIRVNLKGIIKQKNLDTVAAD